PERPADIARGQVAQWLGPDSLKHRTEQARVQSPGPLGPAVQSLAQPVSYRPADRVAGRRADPGVEFGLQRLELVPDLLFGPPEDRPAQPLAVSGVAEGDRPDIAVPRSHEVDRVLAETAAASPGLCYAGSLPTWLSVWLSGDRLKIAIRP